MFVLRSFPNYPKSLGSLRKLMILFFFHAWALREFLRNGFQDAQKKFGSLGIFKILPYDFRQII